MLRRAEDLCRDLHPQTAQQLPQVADETVKYVQYKIHNELFHVCRIFDLPALRCFKVTFAHFGGGGGPQVQTAQVVGPVFSPWSPSCCGRFSGS